MIDKHLTEVYENITSLLLELNKQMDEGFNSEGFNRNTQAIKACTNLLK